VETGEKSVLASRKERNKMDNTIKLKIIASLLPILAHGLYENSGHGIVDRILTAWCWVAFIVALVVFWL
jgi:hypothetical protein